MEIAIDISHNLYESIMKDYALSKLGEHELYKAVQNGTPLPKGHGRLKDADKVARLLDLEKPDNAIAKALKNIMESVPTIIPATRKEGDNADSD